MPTLNQFASGPVRVGLFPGGPRDADNAAYALVENGYTVRTVRGTKMPTVAAVFDEFAAALQFPYYFGANRDAFDECLRDWRDGLDVTPGQVDPAPDLIVVVRDADAVLANRPDELPWLMSALTDAGIRVLAQVGMLDLAAVAGRWVADGVDVVRIDD